MADEAEQWLTEKHYLVCPKGAMFKQMKVTSQTTVTFSGNLAATTADTMKANTFICLGSMAFMAGAIAGLVVAALALLAVPVAGWAMALIIGGALLLAIGAGYLKCKANAGSRVWVNASPNLIIEGNHALVVGKSKLSCPAEATFIDIKETFWEAMFSTSLNNLGHIANFAFGFLAGRGMGSMAGTFSKVALSEGLGAGAKAFGSEFLTVARTEMANMFNPATLMGKMSTTCRLLRGFGMFGAYKGQYDIWSDPNKSIPEKILASGQELILSIFAAKGATLVCFPAGTLIHTSQGLIPIELIKVGTLVWTMNETTSEREMKPVTLTHRRTTLSMMVVKLANGTVFEVTPEHRFLVGNQWREIQEVQALEEVELIDGTRVKISNIVLVAKTNTVYNFDVQDNANYFVTGEGVLVHNGYQQSRLPKSKGEWTEGTPGDGLWKSTKDEVNAITGNEPIPFKNGRPDFSKWKVGDDLKVKGMDGTDSDFGKIYEQMKKDYGFKTQKEAQEWLSNEGLTPHHLDQETVQLIPTDLHGNIPHRGSASEMRELGGL